MTTNYSIANPISVRITYDADLLDTQRPLIQNISELDWHEWLAANLTLGQDYQLLYSDSSCTLEFYSHSDFLRFEAHNDVKYMERL
jgi:hypothetical protein